MIEPPAEVVEAYNAWLTAHAEITRVNFTFGQFSAEARAQRDLCNTLYDVFLTLKGVTR